MQRQGDLLIIKVDQLPEAILKKNHRILAEGEATGHLHELDGGQVYEKKGIMYFKVGADEKIALNHPEHKTITFDTGIYKVIRQREYEPKGLRYVED